MCFLSHSGSRCSLNRFNLLITFFYKYFEDKPMDHTVAKQATTQGANAATMKWNKSDITWMLGLYGTAVGAGTLFLPIEAGIGGIWPLLVMAILALPMTFFAHRALCRFVLSGSGRQGDDITEVVEEHFGSTAGYLITFLYFFAIYPILLVYSVAITNTVESFMLNQLHMTPPPRAILSLVLIVGLMAIVACGEKLIVKAMSVLVFPFVAVLVLMSLFLIPEWNTAIFHYVPAGGNGIGNVLKTLWLVIPVMVFSFNHSPIISSFAVEQKQQYGDMADAKSSRILMMSHIMMVITVMFFVFSCVLSLSPAELAQAKADNISILSYLANKFQNPLIAYLAPMIAFVAITKSFLGHYLGTREGLNGLILKAARRKGKTVGINTLNRITAVFILLTTWAVATWNPSILHIIEMLGGPVIALLLFIMPMYAVRKVPAMKKYAGAPSNIFVTFIGCVAISAIFYTLFH
ncbi:Serine transporter [Plesiomonas shigelloides]|nr:Serine transporter [Plesiomonas shigelloides]SPZ46062.1 Serine transporter [Plesiomonas shigelloides]SUB64220.1 Serine transporter [Plesiomonas shigelloides]